MSNENTPHDPDHRPAVGGPVERMVRPAAEARWYAVTKNGLATLCASERDALDSAASFDAAYPHCEPHRAVLLGDVTAERERVRSAIEAFPHWLGPQAKKELLAALFGPNT